MDWEKGYTAQYYMSVVDPATWRDIERIEITGGSISKESTGLLQSADVDCVKYVQGMERWVRIWLTARQDDSSEHVALFTGLACSPDRDINGNFESNKVQCYSVLKPADDILLERGWYAPSGFDGASLIKRLLSVCPAPVEPVEESPQLKSSIIAEDGETRLTMVWKILKAINWRLKINGKGEITIIPITETPSYYIDAIEHDIIEPKITATRDWYACPNVFRAIEDDLVAIARDDSPDSFLSTVNRGREVWMEETNCDLNEDETVADYAVRRLREEQEVSHVVSYARRYIPDIEPSDLVTLSLPKQDIVGVYKINSQNIQLGYGAKVSEEVVQYER